ncbi:MAG: hypothetical protein ABW034_23585 [Steroidobacteraceae bacterium]
MSDDEALGQAWQHYHRTLEAGRAMVERTDRFREHPEDRAAAYVCLAEAQAMAYNFAVAPRPHSPRVYGQTTWLTDVYTLGGNDASNYYAALFLDGRRTYRLTGRLGDIRIMTLQVSSHLSGSPGQRFIANRELYASNVSADGTFELIFSAAPGTDQDVALDADSDYNFVTIRRQMADWFDDEGELRLELIGETPGDDRFDAAEVTARIRRAADFYTYAIKEWVVGVYDYFKSRCGDKTNTVGFISSASPPDELALSPTTDYGFIIFDLPPDEAMIVEMEVPDGLYWSFQLFDVWGKSIDFMHHQSDINMHRAVIDTDERFRAVIASHDPGVPNWLDSNGHRRGVFIMRNYCASIHPAPALRVVKAAELRKHLPADTPRITSEQRRDALEHRRQGFLRLYNR